MADDKRKILEYLNKHGPTNTFRLARVLGIERHKLLDTIQELEEEKILGFKLGKAIVLKFPVEKISLESKPKKTEKAIKKVSPASPKKGPVGKPILLKKLEAENKKLKEKLLESGKIIKELEQKPPKIIKKTIIRRIPVEKIVVKEVIKKVPIKKEVKKAEKKTGLKINFAKLGQNIKQYSIPDVLKRRL